MKEEAIKEGTDMKEVIKEGTHMKEAIHKGMDTTVVANKAGTEMAEVCMTEVCMAEPCTSSGTTYPNLLQSSVTLRIHVTCVMARLEHGFVGA